MSSFEALHWYALIIPPWVGDTFVNPTLNQERVGGLLMQPEWNALVLSLGLCALLGLPGRRKALGQILWLGGGLLCLLAIYLTYTRAAWLGLLVGGLPWFWYASSNRGVTLRRRMIFVAFVCLMGAVTVLFPSSVTSSRMSDVGTVYYRLQIWAAGFRMLVQHPLFGVGFGEFINHVGGYEQLSQIPQVSDPAGLGDLAHNTFLSVAAELGLIGFGLYLAVIWKAYKAARDGATRFWGEKGSSWVAAFTLVYYANVMFVTAHELVPNVIYFSVMGAIAGYAHSTPRTSRTETTPRAARQRSI
jgi:O-antigen ligase